MQAAKRFIVKMFAKNPEVVSAEAFVPVFQRWIQENFAPDELLIDVVDYKHVHHGPGIILIGYDGDYAYDFAQGQAGIQYTFKQVQAESLVDAVTIAIKRVIAAVEKAETEAALNGLEIDKTKVQITLLDRLNYPNDAETADAVGEALQAILNEGMTISPVESDSRDPLTIVLQGESITAQTRATA